MGRESESIHPHGYENSAGCLLPDIVWDSGSHAGWASSRGHRSAYTIAFPERQTLPYLFYDSLGASSLLEFTQGKESSQQNKVCLFPCVWPAYVIFFGVLLYKCSAAWGPFLSILFCVSSSNWILARTTFSSLVVLKLTRWTVTLKDQRESPQGK